MKKQMTKQSLRIAQHSVIALVAIVLFGGTSVKGANFFVKDNGADWRANSSWSDNAPDTGQTTYVAEGRTVTWNDNGNHAFSGDLYVGINDNNVEYPSGTVYSGEGTVNINTGTNDNYFILNDGNEGPASMYLGYAVDGDAKGTFNTLDNSNAFTHGGSQYIGRAVGSNTVSAEGYYNLGDDTDSQLLIEGGADAGDMYIGSTENDVSGQSAYGELNITGQSSLSSSAGVEIASGTNATGRFYVGGSDPSDGILDGRAFGVGRVE